MIITHRGRNTGKRENTIAAFNKAISLGAEGVECDLRLTLDNQVVVWHDDNIELSGKQVVVSKTLVKDFIKLNAKESEKIIVLDELLVYIINHKHIHFFLEVKSSSEILAEKIIKEIAEKDLWTRVHIIGFSFLIGAVLRLQSKYPKLRVMQFINIPFYSYIRKPAKSYGVFLGWIDEYYGSEWLFRTLIPVSRLVKLREFYEKNGFRVMAGVINRKSGLKYFEQAGIVDINTSNVLDAVSYFKRK